MTNRTNDLRVGWHYFPDAEDAEEFDYMLCPYCEGVSHPVAVQRLRPRNWIEAIADKEGVGRVRVLFCCEDCEHEFAETVR